MSSGDRREEKALANEAYEQRLAATWEKVLADEVNKQRCQVMAARENVLADNAYEQCYQESANVLPPPHCPTTYKDTVLSTMGGEPSCEVFSRCTIVLPVKYG